MSDTQLTVAVGYSIVVAVGIAICLAVYASTRGRRQPADPETYAHRENVWFGVVLAVLLVLLAATIVSTPYGRKAEAASGDGGDGAQRVRVTAVQFAWAIDPPRVKAGTPVRFELRASDVNHNFALYRDGKVLEFQVQVIPGETQVGVHTFDQPGRYEVLCLEFCGLDHHRMRSELVVEPA
jgi:cytochrome c oxidase subunit 2